MPIYSEIPIENEVFDLNKISFDVMYKSFAHNIIKFSKSEEETDHLNEVMQDKEFSFSSQAEFL